MNVKLRIMKFLYLLTLVLIGFMSNAQHSLIMSNPLGLNGGFAGNAGYDRLSFNTNSIGFNNNVGINSSSYQGYRTSISYDWLSTKLKGGIAVQVNRAKYNFDKVFLNKYQEIDTLNNGYIYYDESYYTQMKTAGKLSVVAVTYSPKFILKQRLAFSPYVKPYIRKNNYNNSHNRLDNGAEQDAVVNYGRRVYYNHPQGKHYFLGTELGFLLNKENWFFGYNMYGLNSGMIGGFKYLSHNFQAGKFFSFTKDKKYGVGIFAAISLGYLDGVTYDNFQQPTLSLKLSKFSLGTSYGGFYGYSMFANYKHNNWSLGYSINPIKSEFGGNRHEIGFQYIFKKNKEEDKLFSIPLRN